MAYDDINTMTLSCQIIRVALLHQCSFFVGSIIGKRVQSSSKLIGNSCIYCICEVLY